MFTKKEKYEKIRNMNTPGYFCIHAYKSNFLQLGARIKFPIYQVSEEFKVPLYYTPLTDIMTHYIIVYKGNNDRTTVCRSYTEISISHFITIPGLSGMNRTPFTALFESIYLYHNNPQIYKFPLIIKLLNVHRRQ